MLDTATIDAAALQLVEEFDPESIILFGTQASGMADDKSDVDLLVVMNFHGSRRELMVSIDQSLRDLPFAKDVIVLSPEEYRTGSTIPGTIARAAKLEGKILYERSKR